MLITLLYHRSFECRYGNSLEVLERHFDYLKKNHPIKLPFEPIEKGKWNVCISFDDATYDFYHNVYPLLKKYGLKALLSVPVGYVQEKHLLPPQERLRALSSFSFHQQPPSYAFCSFQELEEMVNSGHIMIASHGMAHVDLSQKPVDLDYELKLSKKILEDRFRKKVEILVLPYGKYDNNVLRSSKAFYKIVMRIGNGVNFSWKTHLHYRVNADQVKEITQLFSLKNKMLTIFNSFI